MSSEHDQQVIYNQQNNIKTYRDIKQHGLQMAQYLTKYKNPKNNSKYINILECSLKHSHTWSDSLANILQRYKYTQRYIVINKLRHKHNIFYKHINKRLDNSKKILNYYKIKHKKDIHDSISEFTLRNCSISMYLLILLIIFSMFNLIYQYI